MRNKMKDIELTILMPCLNEEETLEVCIKKAKKFLKKNKVSGEILIADNGSTDKSVSIALKNGARVINVKEKGYGSALIAGTKNAYGKYIIMGDSDDSYDFLNLEKFLDKLREGYDLVMGNRFAGGIEKGAMPFSHRYIGVPILSLIGRVFFHSKIYDFHCGLRGYNKKSILKLNLNCTGMEYASEMIVKSEINDLKITVLVGLVTGVIPQITPTGSAISVIPVTGLLLTTPTVFNERMLFCTYSQANKFFVALSSKTPRCVSSIAALANVP